MKQETNFFCQLRALILEIELLIPEIAELFVSYWSSIPGDSNSLSNLRLEPNPILTACQELSREGYDIHRVIATLPTERVWTIQVTLSRENFENRLDKYISLEGSGEFVVALMQQVARVGESSEITINDRITGYTGDKFQIVIHPVHWIRKSNCSSALRFRMWARQKLNLKPQLYNFSNKEFTSYE